jgi:hypothetical protein
MVDHLARSRPAADAMNTDEPACCSWSFASIHWAHSTFELQPFSGPKTPHQLLHTLPACLPACLPARLYSLPTAINICNRNLRGCVSKYRVQHPTVP